jgi:hypothetical protein
MTLLICQNESACRNISFILSSKTVDEKRFRVHLCLITMGKPMKHELLDRHDNIAWDMDGTLVDGFYSRHFREYIAKNPHKAHYVVTFRDRKWANKIPDELQKVGFDPALIRSIHACPDHLWLAHSMRQFAVDHSHVEQYLAWKGMTSKKLGCTILVDDMADHVIKGCEIYGIQFLDANDPFQI